MALTMASMARRGEAPNGGDEGGRGELGFQFGAKLEQRKEEVKARVVQGLYRARERALSCI
jgi:hypothetical protein